MSERIVSLKELNEMDLMEKLNPDIIIDPNELLECDRKWEYYKKVRKHLIDNWYNPTMGKTGWGYFKHCK